MTTLLCCLAHPDDAEIWMAGTILQHRNSNIRVIVVCFDTGEPERVLEAKRAAKLLDITQLIILPRNDLWWKGSNNDLERLIDIFTNEKPNVIITHSASDTHPEHQLINQLCVKATIRYQDNCCQEAQLYECSSYLGREQEKLFLPDIFIDITPYWEKKIKAISIYKSQNPEVSLGFINGVNHFYGGLCGVERAEGFRRYPLLGKAGTATSLFPSFQI